MFSKERHKEIIQWLTSHEDDLPNEAAEYIFFLHRKISAFQADFFIACSEIRCITQKIDDKCRFLDRDNFEENFPF